jgi:thiamine-phosphate pyrophosphorylase
VRIFGEKPLIYLITKGEATPENFREKRLEILQIIGEAVRAGVSLIQIREKRLSAKLVSELAAETAQITKKSNTKLLVNDRADIALAAGASGVHLTAGSLSAETIRAVFPAGFIVGVSTHSLAEIEKAERAGADFATFSPVFETPSKKEYGAPQGVAKLREVSETVGNFLVIALGGIDSNNFARALQAGASGVAAIRWLNEAENLGKIVEKIRAYKDE